MTWSFLEKPAPYIKDLNTLIMYTGMDLLRGTNINVGVWDRTALSKGLVQLSTKFFIRKAEV